MATRGEQLRDSKEVIRENRDFLIKNLIPCEATFETLLRHKVIPAIAISEANGVTDREKKNEIIVNAIEVRAVPMEKFVDALLSSGHAFLGYHLALCSGVNQTPVNFDLEELFKKFPKVERTFQHQDEKKALQNFLVYKMQEGIRGYSIKKDKDGAVRDLFLSSKMEQMVDAEKHLKALAEKELQLRNLQNEKEDFKVRMKQMMLENEWEITRLKKLQETKQNELDELNKQFVDKTAMLSVYTQRLQVLENCLKEVLRILCAYLNKEDILDKSKLLFDGYVDPITKKEWNLMDKTKYALSKVLENVNMVTTRSLESLKNDMLVFLKTLGIGDVLNEDNVVAIFKKTVIKYKAEHDKIEEEAGVMKRKLEMLEDFKDQALPRLNDCRLQNETCANEKKRIQEELARLTEEIDAITRAKNVATIDAFTQTSVRHGHLDGLGSKSHNHSREHIDLGQVDLNSKPDVRTSRTPVLSRHGHLDGLGSKSHNHSREHIDLGQVDLNYQKDVRTSRTPVLSRHGHHARKGIKDDQKHELEIEHNKEPVTKSSVGADDTRGMKTAKRSFHQLAAAESLSHQDGVTDARTTHSTLWLHQVKSHGRDSALASHHQPVALQDHFVKSRKLIYMGDERSANLADSHRIARSHKTYVPFHSRSGNIRENRDMPLATSANLHAPLFAKSANLPVPTYVPMGNIRNPLFVKSEDTRNPLFVKSEDTLNPLFVKSEDTLNPLFVKSGDTLNPLFVKSGDTLNPLFAEPRDTRNPRFVEPRDTRNPLFVEPRDTRNPLFVEPRDTRNPLFVEPRDTRNPLFVEPRDTRNPLFFEPRDSNQHFAKYGKMPIDESIVIDGEEHFHIEVRGPSNSQMNAVGTAVNAHMSHGVQGFQDQDTIYQGEEMSDSMYEAIMDAYANNTTRSKDAKEYFRLRESILSDIKDRYSENPTRPIAGRVKTTLVKESLPCRKNESTHNFFSDKIYNKNNYFKGKYGAVIQNDGQTAFVLSNMRRVERERVLGILRKRYTLPDMSSMAEDPARDEKSKASSEKTPMSPYDRKRRINQIINRRHTFPLEGDMNVTQLRQPGTHSGKRAEEQVSPGDNPGSTWQERLAVYYDIKSPEDDAKVIAKPSADFLASKLSTKRVFDRSFAGVPKAQKDATAEHARPTGGSIPKPCCRNVRSNIKTNTIRRRLTGN